MIICIDNLLTTDELDSIHQTLSDAEFIDGKLTAGQYARTVKNNQQLSGQAQATRTIRDVVDQALKRNALFQAAVRPHIIRPALISRYEPGMSYGSHTDNALMGEAPLTRSDVSMTIFLSEPDSYTGGELILDSSLGEQCFKLSAGSAIVYPSTTLHQVSEVTQGVRLAVVTWIQSVIRDSQDRELLFDLDTARRSIFEKYGKTVEFDLLSKTHANLLRKWAFT
ncbi:MULTISPECIES: Fe2+-dependent dioxygenase [unclassified Leptolyngbya]|uniref:Fe2+-dependent dioxygenase n=1 Tax=unclassified Leptolyngbya TaxID=2650499 RepID=UPI0016864164|nr:MULTISPECIES: Fe2+-dependent dioxygenase [unclassified Leptolyngbya]MBD1912027.1 Fe2+-dependent dioxygenase [Leptolyngbya sp. FACHB-8]MBD2155397.1 Fe2+-dependent dioxygenase [Leptolyngbya sp. FACHB-16]